MAHAEATNGGALRTRYLVAQPNSLIMPRQSGPPLRPQVSGKGTTQADRATRTLRQNGPDDLDGRRAAAIGGDERRVEAHRPFRDLEGLRQLGREPAHDDVGPHADH